ncbi:uncharacterized protein LOC134183015 [Corticium candelabrum]|uniref:uncharacterized protein LOC134183015 n=1 Tax=Corticium candelabrum TaxID=121492 RepID=UPI002E262A08|nr:uncharacterized protein LOC134183015 [Corticium candelabrum]
MSKSNITALVAIPSAIQLLFCVVVLRVFYKVRSLRTSANYPIINLIASDFLRGVVGFLAITSFFGSRAETISELSSMDIILCRTVGFCNNVQLAWSSWAIATVSYSRSDVIVNVLSPTFTKKRFWMVSVISWIGTLTTALPLLGPWSSYGHVRSKSNNGYVCRAGGDGDGLLHALYLPSFYFINFLLPTFLVILFFSRIVRTVQHQKLLERSGRSNVVMLSNFSMTGESAQQPSMARQLNVIIRSKAFIYTVVIIITNLVFSFPYVVVQAYTAVVAELGLDHLQLEDAAFQVTTIFFTLNFNINSLLYIFWIKTFQQTAAAMCPCLRRRVGNQ